MPRVGLRVCPDAGRPPGVEACSMRKHLLQVVHFFALLAGATIVVMALIESGVAHTLAIAGGWIVFIGVGLLLARATTRRQHRSS